jgi:hypothetical protein
MPAKLGIIRNNLDFADQLSSQSGRRFEEINPSACISQEKDKPLGISCVKQTQGYSEWLAGLAGSFTEGITRPRRGSRP